MNIRHKIWKPFLHARTADDRKRTNSNDQILVRMAFKKQARLLLFPSANRGPTHKREMTNPSPGEKKPLTTFRRIAISLATAISSILCLVSVIMPIAVVATWEWSPVWPSVTFLILTTGITVALIWLTLYLNSRLKNPEPVHVACQCCGARAPVIKAGLHRHIGAVVFMFHKSINGHLCKLCISKTFWEFTPVTFICGWWGLVSLAITPVILINNVITYLRSLMMEAPTPIPVPPEYPAPREIIPATRVI